MIMDYYYTTSFPGYSSSASSTSTTTSTTHNVMNQNSNTKEKKKKKAGKKKCTSTSTSINSDSGGGGGGGSDGRKGVKLSTDPQSVAARERRHRISERFKILQSLVPGGTKMDTVSMLEEAIHYVKFLKTQIWLHQTIMMMNHFNIVDQPHHDDINVVVEDPPSDVDHDLLLLAAAASTGTSSPNNNNISSLVPRDHHHGDDHYSSLYSPSNLHDHDQVVVVPPAQPNHETAFVQPCTPFGLDDQDVDETTMWLIHDHDDHQYPVNYYY